MDTIRNKKKLISNGRNRKIKQIRRDMLSVVESVLKDIDPYYLVKENVKKKGDILSFSGKLKLDLSNYEHIYVLGSGKAVYKMALAIEKILGSKINDGFINIPSLPTRNELQIIKVNKARHPIPDTKGVYGSKKIKNILESAGSNDLIVAVISGGGSCLMPLPTPDISLSEKIELTSMLLRTPATIHEINVVRKHLSQIKGGQFARFAFPATVVAIYISDIIDDPFDIQASGPTAPDPSTFIDAIKILKKYKIWSKTPRRIKRRFQAGYRGLIEETPNASHKVFSKGKIFNFTIGNHQTAVSSASRKAKKLGYNILSMTSSVQGEAREVSKVLIATGKQIKQYSLPVKIPAMIIAGGETTVTVQGGGKGGRNQELVLSSIPQLLQGMTILSFGTDGVDGINPKPVAGAIADFSSQTRSLKLKLDIQKYLDNNDSYHFFEKMNEHIITGHTGTNVGDLILMSIY